MRKSLFRKIRLSITRKLGRECDRNQKYSLRIREYEAHDIFPGDRLILTAETSRMPLNIAVIRQMIRHYL